MDEYLRGRSVDEEEATPATIGIEDVERASSKKSERQEMSSISVPGSIKSLTRWLADVTIYKVSAGSRAEETDRADTQRLFEGRENLAYGHQVSV